MWTNWILGLGRRRGLDIRPTRTERGKDDGACCHFAMDREAHARQDNRYSSPGPRPLLRASGSRIVPSTPPATTDRHDLYPHVNVNRRVDAEPEEESLRSKWLRAGFESNGIGLWAHEEAA